MPTAILNTNSAVSRGSELLRSLRGPATNQIDLTGTADAAIVAAGASLLTLVATGFRNWWNAPELKMTYLPQDPYRMVLESRPYKHGFPKRDQDGNRPENKEPKLMTAWERFGVRNTGLSTAEKVHGELSSIYDYDQNRELLGLNSIFLAWVPDREQSFISISRKQPVAAGLAYKAEGWNGFTIYADQNMGHEGIRLHYEGSHYLFTVTFYGHNTDPEVIMFEVFNAGTELKDFSIKEHKVGPLAAAQRKFRANVPENLL
ncbi:MAG: hypothetical protein KGI04_03640 [Candidatus Micrarchaeota archaeon]|nr:hypothetical protein [Candidatus Micrarchaeota archaeon]